LLWRGSHPAGGNTCRREFSRGVEKKGVHVVKKMGTLGRRVGGNLGLNGLVGRKNCFEPQGKKHKRSEGGGVSLG